MREISILTFWGVPNYGAFAQAFALHKVLGKKYPDATVKQIAYLHPMHRDLYFKKKKPKRGRRLDWVNIKYYKKLADFYFNPQIEYPNFQKDWDSIEHINIGNINELEKRQWDILVTGSDAIWEYSIPEFGNDQHLIGNNLYFTKLISYAPSFGSMKIDSNFPNFVQNGLKKYNALSVRDKNSQDIVMKLLNHKQQCSLVLDPTLLYDFKNDESIPEPDYEDYILVYGSEYSPELIDEVQDYAKKNHLKIIGAGIAPAWCDVKLENIGPLEWIGMFSKAVFVVTCTFHGLMFSINYDKKVVFNQVEYVKNRSTYLLERLGLDQLFVGKNVSLKEVLNYSWDYSEIQRRLDVMRRESMDFLEGALSNE